MEESGYCACIVKLLEKGSMIHCIVSYRQIDTSGSCGYVPLVVIIYVLREVYNLLVHDFQCFTPVCSLMRCPSTICATYVSIFYKAYTCGISVISVCMVSVWRSTLTVSTILVPYFL